jgi:glycosyltransferase involved in cell wall biosynthesis
VAKDPKIAVVITCFNYEKYIGRAIQSVAGQSAEAYEIVVIDDGSTDGSWAAIEKSGVPAFRIRNSGQREACLYGLSKTRAPFVLFLDADDELAPGALKRILETIDPNVAKLQFCLTCIDAEGHVIADPYPALEAFRGRDRVIDEILRSGVYQTPPTSGNVFRRDVCEILHQCDYDKAVDGVILTAAPFMGDIVSLSESLGLYRVHGQNDSGLGQTLQAVTLERDLRRFQLRLAHLRELLSSLRPDVSLVRPEKTYYFRSLQFVASTLSGARPRSRCFLLLLRSALTEPRSLKWKIANTLVFTAAFLAPRRYARALLVFRYSVGRRSIRELLRTARGSGRA